MPTTATAPVNAFTAALETWMSAHRRMTESMVNDTAFDHARRQGAATLNGSVSAFTGTATEMAEIMSEQARFMGRLMERGYDCVVGMHAARSPEAVAATSRDMMTDCVENAVAVSERVVKLGARNLGYMESIHALFSVPAARTS